MKVNELRIGNFLNPKVNDHILNDEIHIVEPTTLMCILNLVDSKGIEFAPIELTEEWLLKAGFENEEGSRYYRLVYNVDKRYMVYGVGNDYIELCKSGHKTADSKCEYVHQLQNLYFALTGEELQFMS